MHSLTNFLLSISFRWRSTSWCGATVCLLWNCMTTTQLVKRDSLTKLRTPLQQVRVMRAVPHTLVADCSLHSHLARYYLLDSAFNPIWEVVGGTSSFRNSHY
jgi:hypothetical protein